MEENVLNSPVPLILEHQGVSEEEARVESTHVAIRYAATVDDVVLDHFVSTGLCLVFVDGIRLVPVVVGDNAEFHFCCG